MKAATLAALCLLARPRRLTPKCAWVLWLGEGLLLHATNTRSLMVSIVRGRIENGESHPNLRIAKRSLRTRRPKANILPV